MNLASKYRPKEWDSIIEQEYAIKILRNHLKNEKYNPVYLFLAQAGVGKTTLARLFATKINNKENSYIEIDGASYNSAESMRNLVENASKSSIGNKYKVFLIDEVHALSVQAFQVLLKIFEDTPKNTIFLLCTTEAKKVPETIKSRSLLLRLAKITNEGLTNRLLYICEQEKVKINDDIIKYIVNTSKGGLRTAISKLEQIISADIKDLDVAKKVLDLEIDEVVLYKVVSNLDNLPILIEIMENEIYNNCFSVEDFKRSLQSFVADLLKYHYTKEIRFTNLNDISYIDKKLNILKLRKLLKNLFEMKIVTRETLDSLFILFDEE